MFLHEWLYRTGSQSEWVTRLPSVIAGIALVGAIYWTARVFVSSRAALAAAALTALSPLVLEYAQQVRVYVFVMLAVTLALGATVRGAGHSRPRVGMLACGASAAVLAVWLHYTAIFIVAPLCVWIAVQRHVPAGARVAFVGVCAVAVGAEIPLFLKQYHYVPSGGVGPTGGLSFSSLMQIAGTPFDSRLPSNTDWVRVIAALVVLAALVSLVAHHARQVKHRGLLAVLAAAAPLAIFVLGAAGKDVVISRYSAIGAPMLVIAIAAAAASAGPSWRAILAAGAGVAAVVGLVRSHQTTGFYAPAKATIAYIHRHASPQTPIITPGHPGADIPLGYYSQRVLNPQPPLVSATDHSKVLQLLSERRPVWLVSEIHPGSASLADLAKTLTLVLTPFHYRPAAIHAITTTTTFVATLAYPAWKAN